MGSTAKSGKEMIYFNSRKLWEPPKKSRLFRMKEHRRFAQARWYPEKVHTPFNRRHRDINRFHAKPSRFIREHTNCGEIVPYSRFWISRSQNAKHLTHRQLHAWDVRRGFIRYFKPGLIDVEPGTIQPMTSPVGHILTIRSKI
jgi:hypothetical protein